MKKTVLLMLAFALPVFAANEIDTDIDTSHRGYDIQRPPAVETPEAIRPAPREGDVPVYRVNLEDHSGMVIFMGTGVLFADDIIYQNTDFKRNSAPAVQFGIQYDINKHFSAGLSISHAGGNTKTVEAFKGAGNDYRLDFRITSFIAMAGFRYPLSILEPYVNVGFAYNVATIEEVEVSNSNARQEHINDEFTGGLAELGVAVWLTDYLKLSLSGQYMYLDYAAFDHSITRAFLTVHYKF